MKVTITTDGTARNAVITTNGKTIPIAGTGTTIVAMRMSKGSIGSGATNAMVTDTVTATAATVTATIEITARAARAVALIASARSSILLLV